MSSRDDLEEENARLRAENESLRFAKQLLESVWAVHWLTDENGIVKYASQNQVAMGLVRFDGVGKVSIFDFIGEELRDQARAWFREVLAAPPGQPLFMELRGKTASGAWADREVVGVNRLTDPVVRGIAITTSDVGPRNTARHALRTAYERHAIAAEASRDRIWEWDVATDAVTATSLSGGPSESYSAEGATASIHPDDRERLRVARVAQAAGTPMDIEWRLIGPDGEARWHRSVSTVVVEGDRKRVIGRTTDIHERKIAELALADRERLYRELFSATSVAVTLREVETGAFIECNDAALRMLRASTPADLASTTPLDLVPELQPDGARSRDTYIDALQRAKREGSTRLEMTVRRLDGETFVARLVVTKIELQGRSVLQIVTEDVTAEHARLEALARAKEDALAGARAKTAFLATMSHELRSPLNGVIGMVDLLAKRTVDARQKRYVEIARASARGLLSVINDVLDFTKIEAGKLDIAAQELAFQEVLDEAACIFALPAEEKGLDLICSVDVMPRLVGDPARLRQILVNLIGNAVKFTARGEIRVSAKVARCDAEGLDLVVEVADTGVGIHPRDLPRLFVPFASIEVETSRRQSGTGLGLAICRELCERMGGTIRAESTLDVGSRFIVELRLPVVASASNAATNGQLSAQAGRNALVVAGNARIRGTVASALSARGFHAEEADSAENAHARLLQGEHAVAVVIDDPSALDGRAVAARLAADARLRKTRVVFVESLRRPLDDDDARRLHVAARCPSPVWSSRLEAIISGEHTAEAEGARPFDGGVVGARVLVVDDSAVNAEVVTEVLHGAGYRVDAVSDGESAIESLTRRSYDAVLLDCRLPGIDGYETARRIRAFEREGKNLADRAIPIIALTASATSGDVERAFEAGMNEYVSKPFDAARLLPMLADLVRSARVVSPPMTWGGAEPTSSIDLTRALARLGGDAASLGRAARRFMALAPETFAQLSGGAPRRDRRALEFAAHRLRGQALTFDANALVQAIDAIERATAASDWDAVDHAVVRAGHELDSVLRELAQSQTVRATATSQT